MKRFAALVMAVMVLGCVAAACALEADGYVMTYGAIPDDQTYSGSWDQAFQTILAKHYTGIHAYQNRTLEYYSGAGYVRLPCKPVALADLTGDGTPELFFLEAAGESRGDLYAYSTYGGSARCILYVPGITRLGYDDVGLGFDIYLTSAGGGTLALEYWEYERPWRLQLSRNAQGRYTLMNYWTVTGDYSGEGNDTFYRNGYTVSETDYSADLEALRNGRTMTVSSYFALDNSFYGLSMDYETAVSVMGGLNMPTPVPPTPEPQVSADVYGYTIDKLATRKGPGTQYEGGGTYSVKNQWIKVLARAWDSRNGIWWVKCEIPYHGEIRVLWTGWKRFDHSTVSLEDLPEEQW